MEARLQRRVQRYGWDLAAAGYEPLWRAQLADAQRALLALARLAPGEQVLDVASGTGLVAFAAAHAVGPAGRVTGIDLSGAMVEAASRRARETAVPNARFVRMDAERLDLPDASFEVALCALGLTYLPDPRQALGEMRRVLRPGGRMVAAVWGERARCGWAALFGIVDAEVSSEVCPLFFRLGQGDTLAEECAAAGFVSTVTHRVAAVLTYADAQEACDAAFAAGPVALAWSRFEPIVHARVRDRYIESIAPWRCGAGFEVPGEFVIVNGTRP